MKSKHHRFIFFLCLIHITIHVLAQEPDKKGFLRSTVTLEKLKNAKTIDEIIVNFPEGYEVVHYTISIGSRSKDLPEGWKPNYERNVLNNTFQISEVGWRIYIEYIEVKKKGAESKPVRLQPQELIVIE